MKGFAVVTFLCTELYESICGCICICICVSFVLFSFGLLPPVHPPHVSPS
jgi:hypothetical protein